VTETYRQYDSRVVNTTEMPIILVVEPEIVVAEAILKFLRNHGLTVWHVTTGHSAIINFCRADIVLLTFDLPDIDGMEVCRRIRAGGGVPVIAATSGDNEFERIMPLRAGADDCVTKPYGLRELAERVRAVLRRTGQPCDPLPVLRHGRLTVDSRNYQVLLGDRTIPVTKLEFHLLRHLVARPDSVHARRELQAAVWGDGQSASRTIDTHVYSLRRKLGPEWITTIRGIGFQIGRQRFSPIQETLGSAELPPPSDRKMLDYLREPRKAQRQGVSLGSGERAGQGAGGAGAREMIFFGGSMLSAV